MFCGFVVVCDESNGAHTHYNNLGMIEPHQGNYDEAKRLYNEALSIEQKLGDQSGIANTLHQLGRLAELQGDLDNVTRKIIKTQGVDKLPLGP